MISVWVDDWWLIKSFINDLINSYVLINNIKNSSAKMSEEQLSWHLVCIHRCCWNSRAVKHQMNPYLLSLRWRSSCNHYSTSFAFRPETPYRLRTMFLYVHIIRWWMINGFWMPFHQMRLIKPDGVNQHWCVCVCAVQRFIWMNLPSLVWDSI